MANSKKPEKWPAWVEENLYDIAARVVRSKCRSIADRALETADLISEIILKILEKLERCVDEIRNPGGYIYQTAVNYISRPSKKATVSLEEFAVPSFAPPELSEASPLRSFIMSTDRLSKEQKELIIRHLNGEKLNKLIAEDPNNHNLYYRGRQVIKQYYSR